MKSVIAVAAGTLVAGTQAQYATVNGFGTVYAQDYPLVQGGNFQIGNIESTGANGQWTFGDNNHLRVQGGNFQIGNIESTGANGQWTFGDNNQVEDLAVRGGTFQIGNIESSGANGQWTFGDNNKVQSVSFGDNSSMTSSGQGSVVSMGDNSQITMGGQQPSVRDVQIGTITSSGANGRWTFGDGNKIEDLQVQSNFGILGGQNTNGQRATVSNGDNNAVHGSSLNVQGGSYQIGNIKNSGANGNWRFGDNNKLSVQSVTFGKGAKVDTSGAGTVFSLGDNSTIETYGPRAMAGNIQIGTIDSSGANGHWTFGDNNGLSVQGVNFGDGSSFSSSGADQVISFGDGSTIIRKPQPQPTKTITQTQTITQSEDPEVMDFQIGNIESSGANGRWTFGDNNKLQVQGGSVQIGTLNSSGANGKFTFGDNNKLEDLQVEGAYSFGQNSNYGNGNKQIYGDNNQNLNVQGAYAFGSNSNYGNGNQMTFGDNNRGLNVQGAYSFGSNENRGDGNNFIYGDNNNLNVQGAYAFGSNSNYGSNNNQIYGDNNRGLNVQGAYAFGSNSNYGSNNNQIYGDNNRRISVQDMMSQVIYRPVFQPQPGMVYAYDGPMVEDVRRSNRRQNKRPDVYVVVNERV